ncbi:MAG: hypothetical protein DMG32_17005 [Acidobacteria bacterium]|nr:MAG: hypothetical protein DMG32_17005 [Acidobacteriota bacterium]
MTRITIVRIAFLVLLCASFGYAQDPRDESKPPQQEQSKPEPDRDAPPPPHRNEVKPPKQDEVKPPKQERQESAKPPRNEAKPTKEQHGQQAQGHPGHPPGKSVHIPDEKFRASFGRQHTFVISRPAIVEGRPRFQFVGYWFEIIDPWPVDWLYTDDCYIDYIDGDYFLFDVLHPGVRVLVFVIG